MVCGNSLSGETQFAYRVGSFFHETSHGLRRGVIRDVPPEQTLVPVLVERIRGKKKELFAQECGAAAVSKSTAATIIEVPQLLVRLEPKLAALDRDEPAVAEERSAQAGRGPEDPPPKQQELF